MVTEIEREHVMNGSLNDLVEHQHRMDAERDSQVCRVFIVVTIKGMHSIAMMFWRYLIVICIKQSLSSLKYAAQCVYCV